MPTIDDVAALVAKRSGMTEIEIARALFGPDAVQPRVNPACRELVKRGAIERRGSGGANDPYVYFPTRSGDPTPVAALPKLRTTPAPVKMQPVAKPRLSVDVLLEAGFEPYGNWSTDAGRLRCGVGDRTKSGVYAFSQDGNVQYVGVATRSFVQRFNTYMRPGPTQLTNVRLNALIASEIDAGRPVHIHIACPIESSWNGLPVWTAAGLEIGLIRTYHLPWNVRR